MYSIVKHMTYIILLNPQKSTKGVATINTTILQMNLLKLKKWSYLLKCTYSLYPQYAK